MWTYKKLHFNAMVLNYDEWYLIGFFPREKRYSSGRFTLVLSLYYLEEVFTRLLKIKYLEGKITYFSHPRRTPLISHLPYADDVVIFSNGCKKSIKELMEVIDIYKR